MSELRIFSQESRNLPTYLKRHADKLLVSGNIIEGKAGPYDKVFDYGRTREHLRGEVPVEERLISNGLPRVWYASFDYRHVAEDMRELTNINRSGRSDNPIDRLHYQQRLELAYQPVMEEVRHAITGNPVFLPPKNGGDLIRAFFMNREIIRNGQAVVDYELKRVLTESGLLVGQIDKEFPEGNFDTAVILDDCLATDVSASASIHEVKQRYPQVQRFIVTVSAATQRGVEALLSEFSNEDLLVFAAIPVFKMDKQNYLRRTVHEGYPEEDYVVGDMGKWSKKLPDPMNTFAPWNNYR